MKTKNKKTDIKRYKTGILPLDTLLDGGLPKKKIINFGTRSGGGTTTLMLQICRNIIQAYDKKAIFIDVEGGVTEELLRSMGIFDLVYDPDNNPEGKLMLFTTAIMSEIIAIMDDYAKSDDVALAIIDTATSVLDNKILEKDDLGMSDNHKYYLDKMWEKKAKTIRAIIRKGDLSLILTHQVRNINADFNSEQMISINNGCKYMASADIFGIVRKFITKNGTLTNKQDNSVGALIDLNIKGKHLKKEFASKSIALYYGKGVLNRWTPT